jgi:hypothetical protein
MLTLFYGSTSSAFQKILEHFVKPSSRILDITYGKGNSWKGFPLSDKYQLVKLDIKKYDNVELDIVVDHKLLPFPDETFNLVYYDPPYYFREKIRNYDITNQLYSEDTEVFWTEKDFFNSLSALKDEVPRVLKSNGKMICKIMDGYVGSTFFPNHFTVYKFFSNKMKALGCFIVPIQRKDNPSFVRTNHIYYLVFQKVQNATR